MKDIFLKFAENGAMTVDELAGVLRRSSTWVRDNSRPGAPLIPRLPGYPIRFDPIAMIDVFCPPPKATGPGSLTIERHKTLAKPNGGYRKCLE